MEKILYDIANFIKEKFCVKKVILFGSYAYGKTQEDSDIDLFIIMDTDLRFPKQAAIIRTAISENFNLKKPMDIIVRTPKFVEERYKEGDFFVKDILEKGREL
ncbi:MAG: nucleotidyltransferase domain-containing protein [Exilispira sp.]|jgi:predicted nucleotidyltransferase|nr:nucleotidyltransferase domain-containing protein [Exilispira sp.]